MKKPSFNFYPDNWIGGTLLMSFEEEGIYIRLLCLSWILGPQTREKFESVLRQKIPDIVLEKFEEVDGKLKSKRLEHEREKSDRRSVTSKENGLKGGRPKKPKKNLNPNLNKTYPDLFFDNEYEYEYENEIFKKEWRNWLTYKRDQFNFKYKSGESMKRALRQLEKMSGSSEEAVEIINQSIANGWKGLFALKEKTKTKYPNWPDKKFIRECDPEVFPLFTEHLKKFGWNYISINGHKHFEKAGEEHVWI